MAELRIATYNLENLDDRPDQVPTLEERIAVLRPALLRLHADIVCLQEINAQTGPGKERRLAVLDRLLEGTPYAEFDRAVTKSDSG